MNTQTDHTPFFSVIVLNWNGNACLEACLRSLAAQTFRSFTLICVDNASTDGSEEWLKNHDLEKYVNAPVQCIFHQKNRGFAAGMNAGIRRATGKWILPLNVDAELADDFFRTAHDLISRHTEYAMFGPRIMAWDNDRTDTTICTGVWLTRHMSIRTRTDQSFVDSSYPCFGPAGCAPLLKKDALDATAIPPQLSGSGEKEYYDERYFAYGEDVDLYFRLHRYGFHCLYHPSLRVWHRHSATQEGIRWTDKDPATLRRLPANAWATLYKNAPPALLLMLLPLVTALPVVMSLRLAFSRPRFMARPLSAVISTIRNFPRNHALREYISEHAHIHDFSQLFTPDTPPHP